MVNRVLKIFALIISILSLTLFVTTTAQSEWEDLRKATPESPSLTTWDPWRLDAFIKGDGGEMWWKRWVMEKGWTDWASLGGNLTSPPDCVSPAAGLIHCVTRTTFNWLMSIKGTFTNADVIWEEWKFVGGVLGGPPTVTAWVFPDNLVELRAYAKHPSGNLQMFRHNGSVWQNAEGGEGTEIPNSPFDGEPDCIYRGGGAVDSDCVVLNESGEVLHNIGCCLDDRGTQWENLGGDFLSGPTIASPDPDRLYVLARGTNNTLWLKSWLRGEWSEWEEIDPGISLIEAPDCNSVETGKVDCIIAGELSRSHYRKIEF